MIANIEMVESFAQRPLVYTGTKRKLGWFNYAWESLLDSKPWKEQIPRQTRSLASREMEQIAVPAEEPNHLIEQVSLMSIKAWNQGIALIEAVTRLDPDTNVIIPEWVEELISHGEAQIVFTAGDVGVRERNLIGNRVFSTSRNYYAPAGIRGNGKIDKLRRHLNQYWRETYAEYGEYDPAIRVLDTSLSLNALTLRWGSLPSMTIAPGVSTVALYMPRNPLATEKGRRGFMEYLEANNKQNTYLLERGWSPLMVVDGRAGAIQTEELGKYCMQIGIDAQFLSTGDNLDQRFADLEQHGEGVPAPLFRDIILSAATAKGILPAIHRLPSGFGLEDKRNLLLL